MNHDKNIKELDKLIARIDWWLSGESCFSMTDFQSIMAGVRNYLLEKQRQLKEFEDEEKK